MASKIAQNRLAIEIARECLMNNGFTGVHTSKPQGTFPHAHITASRRGSNYLIGVSSREEIGADGDFNPSYNIVKTAGDLERAIVMGQSRHEIPAFVTIALDRKTGSYSAYFGTLASVGSCRSIPMLPQDRKKYELLAHVQNDSRVAAL
jgi:hypothetical protein